MPGYRRVALHTPPMSGADSKTATSRPSSRNARAAARPEGPAPTTATRMMLIVLCGDPGSLRSGDAAHHKGRDDSVDESSSLCGPDGRLVVERAPPARSAGLDHGRRRLNGPSRKGEPADPETRARRDSNP